MKRHVSAEALARFREGDLSQRKAARVSRHLTGCARCTDLSAELAGITILLASTPAPAMPERLAAMIQDTLAAEAARRVALDPGTEPQRRDLPGHRARSRPPRPALSSPLLVRALAAAGAIVVIAGGSYLAIRQNTTTGLSSGSAASPGALSHAGAGHGTASHSFLTPTFGPELHYGPRGSRASVVPVATGTNFAAVTLTGQVSVVIAQYSDGKAMQQHMAATASPAAAPPAAVTSPDQSRFGGVPVSALQGCVSRIAAGGKVLLVDVARYQGRRATVIVVAPAGSAPRQVWVVGPDCSTSRSDVLAQQSLPGG